MRCLLAFYLLVSLSQLGTVSAFTLSVVSYSQNCLNRSTRSALKAADGNDEPTGPGSGEGSTNEGASSKDNNNLVDLSLQQKQQPSPPFPRAQRQRLDPLLLSVTRNNDPNYDPNKPTVSVPFIGELVMDRSFFLFVPAAVFAVLGLFSSVLVLLNSGDAFVEALDKAGAMIPASMPETPMDPNECRGICSTQEQDLEGLRSFLKGVTGR